MRKVYPNKSVRRFLLPDDQSSISAMKYDIVLEKDPNRVLEQNNQTIEALFHIYHGRRICIHSNPEQPLNSYVRKLEILAEGLATAIDAVRTGKEIQKREWLDINNMHFNSALTINTKDMAAGFITISDCNTTIRFSTNRAPECIAALESISQMINDLIIDLEANYEAFFMDTDKLKIDMPKILAQFKSDASVYNWRTHDDFREAVDRYVKKHSRNDPSATSFLYHYLEQLSETLWEEI